MPPVTHGRNTSLFRISMELDEELDLGRLSVALGRVAARFPYFDVELKRGFFWYRFVPTGLPVAVEEDPPSPCQGFDPNRRGTRLFRIRVKGRRLAGEFSHIVADGKGGIRFMKTLVSEYCRLSGSPQLEPDADVYRLDEGPSPEECEDAYVRHYRPGLPLPETGKRAFRLSGELLEEGQYRVSVARIPLDAVLALAKSRGATLTEFIAAVQLEVLQAIWLETPPRERGSGILALEIPVDMRRYYRTATNRNFTLFVVVNQDMGLGARSFDSILERLKLQFRFENDEASIARQISRNVHGMKHPLIRALPLPVKDLGARILFRVLGEEQVTSVVTNLGAIGFPEGLAGHVGRFDLVQPPSTATLANLAIHSWKGELYVSAGSLLRSSRFEDLLFSRLAAFGLDLKVDRNLG
jgi:hypothetical protein